MTVYGPTTKDTSTLALGLAQIRVGDSATNIGDIHPALTSSDSIGSMANTKFTVEKDIWKHESGFPLLEDYSIPLRVKAMLECSFEEVTPYNLALANGVDPASDYPDAHSGELALGALATPDYIRMEAHYTFPDPNYTMDIIFPRAQVASNIELDLQKEDGANSPIVFEAKKADSDVSGGDAVWDDKPLGRVAFGDAS